MYVALTDIRSRLTLIFLALTLALKTEMTFNVAQWLINRWIKNTLPLDAEVISCYLIHTSHL
jgi:hypothetical protein